MTAPRLGHGERELLLACARVEAGPEDRRRLARAARRPLDWEAVLFHARLHSIGPLVHAHVGAVPGLELPDQARDGLLLLAHRAAYQNGRYAEEHAAIVSTFAAAGVPLVAMKGLPVAERVYGDRSRRPLIDLVFLAPAGIAPAQRLLEERGYRASRTSPWDALHRWTSPQRFLTRRAPFRLDVLLLSSPVASPCLHDFHAAGVLARARREPVAGVQTLRPDPVDQLLYLALQVDAHGAYNRAAAGRVPPAALVFDPWWNNRLVRLVDIRETARREAPSAEVLVRRARSFGVEAPAATGLRLAAELLGRFPGSGALSGDAPPPPPVRTLLLRRLGEVRPAVDGSGGSRAAWERRLPRLGAVVELAFPGRRALARRYRLRSRPLVAAAAVIHPVSVLARTVGAFTLAGAGELRLRARDRIGAP
jgi:hypothetical protein